MTRRADKFKDNPPTGILSEYLDPRYWNPECKGFQLIDWEKWESQNPRIPEIFDPPQKSALQGCPGTCLWVYTNRSWFCQPIPSMCYSCLTTKPETLRISDGDFKGLLNPDSISPHAPAAFRDHLLWTDQNIAPETLASLGSWAWRPQTDESRVIGVGTLEYAWTNHPTCAGVACAKYQKGLFSVVQMSPDGKWILMNGLNNPSKDGSIRSSLWFYVVQEGDVFKNPDGKVIDHIQPGDLCRITWSNENPYDCDNNQIRYMYFPRRVATINEQGEIVKNSPHYDDLLARATAPQDKCCQTCCFTCACCMSAGERFDYTNAFINDTQIFAKAPTSPPLELIDRL